MRLGLCIIGVVYLLNMISSCRNCEPIPDFTYRISDIETSYVNPWNGMHLNKLANKDSFALKVSLNGFRSVSVDLNPFKPNSLMAFGYDPCEFDENGVGFPLDTISEIKILAASDIIGIALKDEEIAKHFSLVLNKTSGSLFTIALDSSGQKLPTPILFHDRLSHSFLFRPNISSVFSGKEVELTIELGFTNRGKVKSTTDVLRVN